MKSRRRRMSLVAVLISVATVLAVRGFFSEPEPTAPVVGDGPFNLTIFHTNDIHGAFMSEPATWRDDKAPVGGFVALASHLAEQGRDESKSLLLDGGDFMTGDPVCDMEVGGVRGAAIVDMMNASGYDVSVVGNHEFDNGLENLHGLIERAEFPVLAADVMGADGDPEFEDDPLILERGGLKIGVMGVSCGNLFDYVTESRAGGLSLRGQAETVREMIADLDPVTDLMVLITHNGVRGDTLLARELEGAGPDIIVGAHSHTRLRQPLLIGETLVVQAGSHLKNLGRLDLEVADDRVVSYRGKLIQLLAEDREAGPELTGLAERFAERVRGEYGRRIGELLRDWRRNGRAESNIGDWLADALREAAGADIGLINSGTIRKNIDAGPITALDIHQLLPFSNTLVTFEADGEAIARIVAENASSAVGGGHGILQVSGLSYRYADRGGRAEVLDIAVDGQPLDLRRVYTVACPDYVAMKADVYLDMTAPETAYRGMTITEAVLRAVEASDGIDSVVDGRITEMSE